jgi:hypothetical protein
LVPRGVVRARIERTIIERYDDWKENIIVRPANRRDKTRPRTTKAKRTARAEKAPAQPVADSLPSTDRNRRIFAGFERERATYNRLRSELLVGGEGKFVVIVGDDILGPMGTHEEAERAGYKRFGLGPLYVRQILAKEPVIEVTRLHHP